MTVPSLPVELLEKIVISANRRQLGALSCASHTFQAVTEPVLYNDIGDLGFRGTIHAIRSILRSGRIYRRKYVRKFSINVSTWMHPSNPQFLRGFFRLVARALEALSQLDVLHLIGLPLSEAWVLCQCSAQPIAFVTNIPPGPILSSWLEKQRRMEIFVLANKYAAHWDDHVQVSPAALPNLRMVCAKANTLQRLVPGRPVDRVVLDFTLDNKTDGNGYEEMKEAFMSSSRSIHTFAIHFRPAPRNLVVAPGLPMFVSSQNARQLENVTLLDIQVPTFDFFDALPDMMNTVEAFPKLSDLRVSGRHLTAVWTSVELENYVNVWRSHCSSLSRTALRESMDSIGHGNRIEFAWDTESQRMIPVSSGESNVPGRRPSEDASHKQYEHYSSMLQVALRS